jgi:hypothetical protein
MIFILVLLGSIIGAAAGYIAAAAIGYVVAGAMGMSDFEGGRAILAAFFAGPIGGIAGFFFGVWLPLRLRKRHSIPAVLGYSALSIVAISLIAGAVAGYFYFDNAPIYRDGSRFALEFEIRLPANATAPASLRNIRIELDTAKNTITGDLDPSATHKDGERTVLVGEVELYFRTSSRTLALQMPQQPDRIFKLPLAAAPSPFEEFTPWARVDLIGEPPDHPRVAAADAADDFDIRYRLPDPRKPVPYIEFEIRLPAGTRLPDDFHALHTAQRRDDADDDWGYFLHENWKRLDGDRPVLMGSTAIRKPTKHPKLTLKLLEGPLLVFDLAFPETAKPTPDFGPWTPVTTLETYRQPPRPPGPDDKFELRYRIDPPR